MKYKLFVALFVMAFTLSNAQNSTDEFFKRTDAFFKSYVKNGQVAYQRLSENNSDLKEIIKISNSLNVDKNNQEEYKSFWINVYNLGVIEQIVDNYPVNSPMQISGFFDGNKRDLGGKEITLNDIENKMLRADFKDPRFHFVLVCGAVSCPPIVNYAYTPELLESQLETQTKLALNNTDFIKSSNEKTEISEIFSWYKKDFGSSKANVTAFINTYRANKITKDFSYYSYNWQLNDQENLEESTTDVLEKELSNVQSFTPSKLLSKGQFDVKWFNSVFTQTKSADSNSNISSGNPRESFFTSTLEFYYGISENSRINIGFIGQGRANTFGDSNALSVFNLEDNGAEAGTDARSGITTIAPSVRIQPFASVANFSITSSFFFPIFEKNKNLFLDKDSYVWETKFFFDHTFGNNQWQVFTEVDLAFNFGDEGDGEEFANDSLGLPISAFLSYFPTDKSTVFVSAQQTYLIDLGNDFEQNFTSIGLGGKYQVTDRINVEASYGRFVAGKNTGIGESFSIGLRYLSAN